MKVKHKLSEFLKIYHSLGISWQIDVLIVLYLIVTFIAFLFEWKIGLLLLLLFIAGSIFIFFNLNRFLREINALANRLSMSVNSAQEESLYHTPIGIMMYDDNNRVKWVNPSFNKMFSFKNILGEKIKNLELTDWLDIADDDEWHVISNNEHYYKIMHNQKTKVFYLYDVTKEQNILNKRQHDKIVFGYLYLDDYDELIQSMDDEQEAKFDAELIAELNHWATIRDIYLKRLSNEKFLCILNQHNLDILENKKFEIINDIRKKNYAKNIPVSISLGIAYSQEETYSIDDLAKEAQRNLDLALGRGGDQVVVRAEGGKARFYGGQTNPTEKRTNIRSKLVYQALENSVQQASDVFITGHKYPDMDAMGSAIGIYKIVTQYCNKKAKIILDEDTLSPDIRELLNQPQMKGEYPHMYVSLEQAENMISEDSLIIMVDHHRPSLSIAEPLINEHDVVVIDHHRRSEEFPEHSVLTFIEPYASSTSELVTEFFMYLRNSYDGLNRFEATVLLAGIIVDTNNFSARTGSRTFDTASYLRSRGASMQQIQRLLKEDFDQIILRYQLLTNMEMIDGQFAITYGDDSMYYNNVTAAQTADLMLTLKKVEASFVIYRRSDDVVGISARSLGTLNVQTIMEKLGGGGHLSNAATQITGKSVLEVKKALLQCLQDYKEED